MTRKNLYKATITDLHKNMRTFDIKFLADGFESAFGQAKILGSLEAAHRDSYCGYTRKVISVESVEVLEKNIIVR